MIVKHYEVIWQRVQGWDKLMGQHLSQELHVAANCDM